MRADASAGAKRGVPGNKAMISRRLISVALIALLASTFAPLAALAAPGAGGNGVDGDNVTNWAPPTTVYIPETGQSIDGVFLDFWRANNGIANYGYPITPEVTQNGRIVQYYSYARFEYVPDDPNGVIVQLGKIGEDLRPKTVQRSPFSGVGIAAPKQGANREMTAFAAAWLPVEKKLAKKETTASWRYVAETGHTVQNGFKALWEATGEASYLGNPLTEEYVLKGVTYQTFERGQLAWEQGKDPWFVPLGPVVAKKYGISMAATGQGDLPTYSEDLFVEPKPQPKAGNGGERWIEVNLSQQYMTLWEGDVAILGTYVSTGRPGFDTPEGTFYINTKLESQTMEGVLGGEEYHVPDVPWVMYFTNVGHAIHGAYWHNNFGAVMSHGCVNLPMDVASFVYSWSSIGTRVYIHY